MEPSEGFLQRVQQAWGNSKNVADTGMNELFNHGEDISLDYDDQIRYALQIGVLAGSMQHSSPEEFVAAYTEQILSDE